MLVAAAKRHPCYNYLQSAGAVLEANKARGSLVGKAFVAGQNIGQDYFKIRQRGYWDESTAEVLH